MQMSNRGKTEHVGPSPCKLLQDSPPHPPPDQRPKLTKVPPFQSSCCVSSPAHTIPAHWHEPKPMMTSKKQLTCPKLPFPRISGCGSNISSSLSIFHKESMWVRFHLYHAATIIATQVARMPTAQGMIIPSCRHSVGEKI